MPSSTLDLTSLPNYLIKYKFSYEQIKRSLAYFIFSYSNSQFPTKSVTFQASILRSFITTVFQ